MVVYALPAEIRRIAARPDVDVVELNFKAELIAPDPSHGRSETTVDDKEAGHPRHRRDPRPARDPRAGGLVPARLQRRRPAHRQPGHRRRRQPRGARHPLARLPAAHSPGRSAGWTCSGPARSSRRTPTATAPTPRGPWPASAPPPRTPSAWPGRAKWIACNAINQGVSSGFDQDIITAFQWFADPDGNPSTVDDVPDVVQNSWGINEGFAGRRPTPTATPAGGP